MWLIHRPSQATAKPGQKRCCKCCHIHAGGTCHLFCKAFTGAWPMRILWGSWVHPDDQTDHWQTVPKHTPGHRSRNASDELQTSVGTGRLSCLSVQRRTGSLLPGSLQGVRRRQSLGFPHQVWSHVAQAIVLCWDAQWLWQCLMERGALGHSPPSLKPG